MILDLKGVFDCEGYSRNIDYDYDMSSYQDPAGGHPLKEPVKVKARLRNRAGIVELHVETQFDYFTECDRCCAPLKEHYGFTFDNVLSKQASGEGESGDIIQVEGDTFDLDELVSSNVILNLPMKHLCSEDCKGLCPICGKNLNEGPCGCKREINSPFSKLLNLK